MILFGSRLWQELRPHPGHPPSRTGRRVKPPIHPRNYAGELDGALKLSSAMLMPGPMVELSDTFFR